MGNGLGKITACFTGDTNFRRAHHHDISLYAPDPLDEGLGHSFCYVRPDPTRQSSSKVHSEETTTFKTISGASVSANTSTPLSTDLYSYNSYSVDRAAAFESSTSFASIPLQPIPRSFFTGSGPISGPIVASGPLERGFMSGPIERGFMSGPLDHHRGLFSGPIDKDNSADQFPRSFSHGGGFAFRRRSRKGKLIRILRRAISKTIRSGHNSIVAPIKGFGFSTAKEQDWGFQPEKTVHNPNFNHNGLISTQSHNENLTISSLNLSSEGSLDEYESFESQNLQWAQGKAGEDRVHVVVSEEHGWVFVGIYDGFNGPDAPDFLLSNLYSAVHKELKGLLWDEKFEAVENPNLNSNQGQAIGEDEDCSQCVEQESSSHPCASGNGSDSFDSNSVKNGRSSRGSGKYRGAAKKWEDNQRRWRCEWDRERVELDRRLKEQLSRSASASERAINHNDVLKALSQALRKTEDSFLDIADKILVENPELALMGSCVLVMLMKGEDVYVMNVGDSRAVLGQKSEPDYWLEKIRQDLERINEETLHDLEGSDTAFPRLSAVQLTKDHSTSVEEEVHRIKDEHPDDSCAVVNDRVKGSLKVTRAFGAGFLKQPKWNNALLEMFRIDYVGKSPYITCFPCLHHHRLGSKDRFLILSSDGLYQYFTNEEAVSEVELFITLQPEGDPAQHLVEEVLFRAAKKAGLDFHELLEIPQGDRRRYHDDVSIIVISLEGRIWRSCV